MRLLKVALGTALLSLAAPCFAAAVPSFPERGRAAVVDAADVIPNGVESDLNEQIVAWNRATGHQFVVATVPSLLGLQIQDYGTQLLRHWRLGRAEANDGAILLLAPNERQVRIEVGYGLEPVLTDARTSMIIQETIRPALAGDDIAGALTAGAKRIMREASSDPAETASLAAISKASPPQADPPFPLGFFLVIGALIGGIVLLVLRRRRRGRGREPSPDERNRRRYATVPRAEHRAVQGKTKGRTQTRASGPPRAAYSSSNDPLMALQERGYSSDTHSSSYDSSSWDSSSSSSSSSSSDSGFDSGGGSGGGGGSDSSY